MMCFFFLALVLARFARKSHNASPLLLLRCCHGAIQSFGLSKHQDVAFTLQQCLPHGHRKLAIALGGCGQSHNLHKIAQIEHSGAALHGKCTVIAR